MRNLLRPALLVLVMFLGGCGYFPVPLDPIRYDTSSGDVSTCRRLGTVGLARTDGVGPYDFGEITTPVPFAAVPGASSEVVPIGGEIGGRNLAVRLDTMRDAALALGATDLLLSRRVYRDWSYVEGIAYRCAR